MAYYRKKFPPDVLYYATNQSVIDHSNGCIKLSNNRRLFLSHLKRMPGKLPIEAIKKSKGLFLDVPQAWRNGVYFIKTIKGFGNAIKFR